MKKYFALVLVVFVAFACKKKDDDGAGQGSSNILVGYWEVDEIEFTGVADVGGQTIALTGEGANYVGGYHLNADYTMTYDTQYDLIVNVPLLGQQTVPVDVQGSGTWKEENDIIYLIEPGRTQEFPVKVATSSILIIEQDTTVTQAGLSADLNLEITMRK